jgi:hypothetical protein
MKKEQSRYFFYLDYLQLKNTAEYFDWTRVVRIDDIH